jgi:hypothetical protein
MNQTCLVVVGAGAVMSIACGALGAMVDALVTADNHYALYATGDTGLVYHGGNEIGSAGAPGAYNWSLAETYHFHAQGTLYIAAWSDGSTAQGVLAQIMLDGGTSLSGGYAKWEVYRTDVARHDGDPHPTVPEMSAHILAADTGSLWQTPYVGGGNGLQPWGTISGIGPTVRWMWASEPDDADPLQGAATSNPMLIFRAEIPSPASAGLLGLGGLFIARRRR